MSDPKILTIDIETAPHVAYVWGFWKNNISPKQVLQNSYIMSFAAKWLGKDTIIYNENRKDNDKELVMHILRLLDAADIVIAHNAVKFDIRRINARAIVHRFDPPSPYKVIDTLRSVRQAADFSSHSLENLAKVLQCEEKLSHKNFPGFELWLECLKGNPAAWEEMKEYNIQDVVTLEEVYLKLRPWIRNHPNLGVLKEHTASICPKCGSPEIIYRGYTTTNTAKYRKFKCSNCGGWGRSRFTEMDKEVSKSLITNA